MLLRLGGSPYRAAAEIPAARVARELDILLIKPEHANKAREIGKLLRSENGVAVASDLIEQVLNGGKDLMTPDPKEPVYAACD